MSMAQVTVTAGLGYKRVADEHAGAWDESTLQSMFEAPVGHASIPNRGETRHETLFNPLSNVPGGMLLLGADLQRSPFRRTPPYLGGCGRQSDLA